MNLKLSDEQIHEEWAKTSISIVDFIECFPLILSVRDTATSHTAWGIVDWLARADNDTKNCCADWLAKELKSQGIERMEK